MATIREMDDRGEAGFEPEWDDYTGRAYRIRVRLASGGKATKTWFLGRWFRSAYQCEQFLSKITRKELREEIGKRLAADTDSVLVETTSNDFHKGEAASRIRIATSTRYPISKGQIQWARGERTEHPEPRPAPTDDDLLDAEIGHGIAWHVFVWDDGKPGWRYVAGLAEATHKDALTEWLTKQGCEVYVHHKS